MCIGGLALSTFVIGMCLSLVGCYITLHYICNNLISEDSLMIYKCCKTPSGGRPLNSAGCHEISTDKSYHDGYHLPPKILLKDNLMVD